jgi:hypothetical protein
MGNVRDMPLLTLAFGVMLLMSSPVSEGVQQKDGQHCAGSSYAVGDGFSWGYIKYIGVVTNRKGDMSTANSHGQICAPDHAL